MLDLAVHSVSFFILEIDAENILHSHCSQVIVRVYYRLLHRTQILVGVILILLDVTEMMDVMMTRKMIGVHISVK